MYIKSPSKRAEKVAKVLALIFGIVCGCFYASFSRSATRQGLIFSKTAPGPTIEPIAQQQERNETAEFLVSDDTTIADGLSQSIKVLCWIHFENVEKDRFVAIQRTWGGRCTKLIGVSHSGNNETDIFIIPKGQDKLKDLENTHRFIYNMYGDEFDWFIRTDGRSYVVMENLRFKVYAYSPLEPIALGLTKKDKRNREYLSERGGYVLSKSALETLVNGFDGGLSCTNDNQINEQEVRFGQCLKEVGILYGKSTDDEGKQLFFDEYLDRFFLPEVEVKLPYPWYQEYEVNHYLNSASNFSITFFGLSWQQMHVMEFLIYQLRPYGLETITPPLPQKISLVQS